MAQHEYPNFYELTDERPMITAYNMAMSYIADPPIIHMVQWKDARILVNASDEISVSSVRVHIHDVQGRLLEVGDAHQTRKDWGNICRRPDLRDRL
jgi:hypothetical protein